MKGLIKLTMAFYAVLSLTVAYGTGTPPPAGGRYSAMGSTRLFSTDVWSSFNNQAGLGMLEQPEIGVSFSNLYSLKEFNTYSLGFALPAAGGTFGLMYFNQGDHLMSHQKAGLGYGMKLSKRASAGVQIDMLNTRFGMDYGSKTVVTFEAGLLVEVHKGVFVAAHVFNPHRAKFAGYMDERIPSVVAFGLCWDVSENLTVVAEAEKNEADRPVVKTGIEYTLGEAFQIRGGMNTQVAEFSFGFGYHVGNWGFDLSSALHPQLGISSQVSAAYRFGRKTK